jgi:hypothetical protein
MMFEITKAERAPEHKNGLAVLFNAQHWVTMSGSHVMIDGDGNVVGGAGGNLKGKQFKLIRSKSNDQQKYLPAPKSEHQESTKSPEKTETKQIPEQKINEKKIPIKFLKQVHGKNIKSTDDLKTIATKQSEIEKSREDQKKHDVKYASHKIMEYFKNENIDTGDINESNLLDNYKKVHELVTRSGRSINVLSDLKDLEYWRPSEIRDTPIISGIVNPNYRPTSSQWQEVADNADLYFSQMKEEGEKKDDILKKYGSGSWNKKVYGRKGNYSIYLSGKIKKISDEDANELMK